MILQLIAGVTAGVIAGLLIVATLAWASRELIFKLLGQFLMQGLANSSPVVRAKMLQMILSLYCPECGGVVHPEEHPEKPEEKPL